MRGITVRSRPNATARIATRSAATGGGWERDAYQRGFRRGFESGYRDGFDRYARYDRR